MRKLELLAPARNIDTALEAIAHGADAVYIGGPSHGARAAASNSVGDIARLADTAHTFGVKVYVTLNTIIHDRELKAVEATVRDIYRAHADALIVQDMGLLRLDLPPIDLHASTQCDIRTPEKARFLAACGFSQLVLPREFSISEIEAVREAVPADVALEAFVHGALCVSYSGDCQASAAACGRSANRGECAQMCRLPYDLTDSSGRVLVADRHLLSLRDLCRITDLGRLAAAGISSFKIEGRLKDAAYVKTVTLAYRRALDQVITDLTNEREQSVARYSSAERRGRCDEVDNTSQYCRASWGDTISDLEADVTKVFNRGFTSYFIDGRPQTQVKMASADTPKWAGLPVGKTVWARDRRIKAQLSAGIANGDGLGYFDADRHYAGFRVNRVDGDILHTASPVKIAPGTTLYRNNDTRLTARLAGRTAVRKIAVDLRLALRDSHLSLSVSDSHGHSVTAYAGIEPGTARSPQRQSRATALAKLGDTPLAARSTADEVPDDTFIPLSALTALRRRACDLFISQIKATYTYRYRRAEDPEATYPHTLTYHDNVANDAAGQFYADHHATVGQRAIETTGNVPPGTMVMTTRYCLRRELGACLLTPSGRDLPSHLFLTSRNTRYALQFDCKACRMHLLTTEKSKTPR